MRRAPSHTPPVAVATVASLVLVLAGCDADGGATATQTPTVPTSGATMNQDDADGTSGTPDGTGATSEETAATSDAPPVAAAALGAGAVLTTEDSGAVVRLAPGEEAVLRLTPPLQDSTPRVADPEVVELVPVQHFADPGYAEYQLLAQAPGQTRIAARAAGADGPSLLVLVEVRGP